MASRFKDSLPVELDEGQRLSVHGAPGVDGVLPTSNKQLLGADAANFGGDPSLLELFLEPS